MHIPRAIVDRSNGVFFHIVADACIDNARHTSRGSGLSLRDLELVSHDIIASKSTALAEALSRNLFIRLTGDETHHLLNVLRLGVGAAVEIFYRPSSGVFRGIVSHTSDDELIIRLDEQIEMEAIPKIHLLVGLIRPQKADTIVEQCAGLGVSSLSFFAAERSQNRGEFSAIEKRLDRWGRIARSATLQSGFVGGEMLLSCQRSLAEGMAYTRHILGYTRHILGQSDSPNAHGVSNHFVFTDTLNGVTVPRLLDTPQIMNLLRPHLCTPLSQPFACVEKNSFAVADMLTGARRCNNRLADDVSDLSTSRTTSAVAVIGPEGGLTDSEISLAIRSGFVAVSLGGKTLRTEVAALLISGLLMELLSR